MKTEKIMRELMQGGLVIADRNVGKSTALIELAGMFPDEYVIFAPSLDFVDRLRQLAKERDVKVRIVSRLKDLRGESRRILVEEFFLHRELPTQWHAAVASVPFRVVRV